ncbi:MAG: hypothetical protein QM737_23910 [Ferruginibacter sp.]
MNRGRSLFAGTLACAILTLGFGGAVTAQEPASIKIGYAISQDRAEHRRGRRHHRFRTIELWVKEVNDGRWHSRVGGKRVPIEIIEYDDRSNSEEAVRARRAPDQRRTRSTSSCRHGAPASISRSARCFNKYGYPQLAVEAVTDSAPELAKRWPNSFWLLGTSSSTVDALVDLLTQDAQGRTRSVTTSRWSASPTASASTCRRRRAKASTKAKFKLAYDKSYPIGTQDLSPMRQRSKGAQAPTCSSPSAIRLIRWR